MAKGDELTPDEVRKYWDNYTAERPPDNPPIVKLHSRFGGQYLPEDYRRRIFGTPPPPGAERPVPPPPLPPNSYHKKPKYWQMRGTSHMELPNRAAATVAFASLGLAFLIDRYNKNGLNRLDRWFGVRMTPQEKIEYDQKIDLYANNMLTLAEETWETDPSGERYKNLRRHKDDKVRWDIREVDMEVIGIRDMTNPFDDAL